MDGSTRDAQTLDRQFNEVPLLAWLPWVGVDYLTAPPEKRILIIGESHYYEGGNAGKEGFFDRSSTRDILRGFAVSQRSGKSRFLISKKSS